ncbi:hypothetical protein C8R43DRAFT_196208 [Mycena crocata]|nr:hypothetical protein C8R43DRAFT_196208 [Mycena crocata]
MLPFSLPALLVALVATFFPGLVVDFSLSSPSPMLLDAARVPFGPENIPIGLHLDALDGHISWHRPFDVAFDFGAASSRFLEPVVTFESRNTLDNAICVASSVSLTFELGNPPASLILPSSRYVSSEISTNGADTFATSLASSIASCVTAVPSIPGVTSRALSIVSGLSTSSLHDTVSKDDDESGTCFASSCGARFSWIRLSLSTAACVILFTLAVESTFSGRITRPCALGLIVFQFLEPKDDAAVANEELMPVDDALPSSPGAIIVESSRRHCGASLFPVLLTLIAGVEVQLLFNALQSVPQEPSTDDDEDAIDGEVPNTVLVETGAPAPADNALVAAETVPGEPDAAALADDPVAAPDIHAPGEVLVTDHRRRHPTSASFLALFVFFLAEYHAQTVWPVALDNPFGFRALVELLRIEEVKILELEAQDERQREFEEQHQAEVEAQQEREERRREQKREKKRRQRERAAAARRGATTSEVAINVAEASSGAIPNQPGMELVAILEAQITTPALTDVVDTVDEIAILPGDDVDPPIEAALPHVADEDLVISHSTVGVPDVLAPEPVDAVENDLDVAEKEPATTVDLDVEEPLRASARIRSQTAPGHLPTAPALPGPTASPFHLPAAPAHLIAPAFDVTRVAQQNDVEVLYSSPGMAPPQYGYFREDVPRHLQRTSRVVWLGGRETLPEPRFPTLARPRGPRLPQPPVPAHPALHRPRVSGAPPEPQQPVVELVFPSIRESYRAPGAL